jgi:tetratricopeptide (TPR) repeat protein
LFDDEASFEDYVKVNGVDRVVFSNPYGNERLLNIYKLCRARGIEIVVGERGALPDSVYHDRNGFLVDSSSYNEEYWNRPLNANEESNVSEYIAYIRSGEHALEQQSERRTVPSLRKKLGISRGKKILFVPFQQPNDTVIRYFSGPVGSFESFRKEIARIAANIGDDWCVVYKKHPVEDELAGIDGAIEANDINVYDLLEMADAVALINSGVGIYAMMYGKPLYVFGESWYGHEGLCRVIREHEDAVEVIRAGFDVDYEKVLRFIHYLRFEFYSFGKMTARRVRYQDGTPITATSQINYYELRGWSDGVRRLPTSWSPIAASSQLFDRYRNSWKADAQPKTAKAKTVASPANNVTPASQPKPVNAPKATSVDGLIKEAAIAYSKKNYLEAAKIFDKALEQGGENPACLRWAAEAFYAAGDISSALSRLQRASALIPGNKNVKARISVLKAPAWKRALLPSKAFDMPTVS